jgi:hypothetical protein
MNARHWIFAGLSVVAAGALAAYVHLAAERSAGRGAQTAAVPMSEVLGPEPSQTPAAEAPATPDPPVPAPTEPEVASVAPAPASADAAPPAPAVREIPAPAAPSAPAHVFFRHNGVDADYGRLAVSQLVDRGQRQFVAGLSCEVAYVARTRGICLVADRGILTTYRAVLFDLREGRTLGELPLAGPPSRARVSADGRLAALTVFVTGHSYTSVDFSTQTLLVDIERGAVLADVQQDFEVRRDGKVIREEDFNFWGVTFTPDSRSFYATLSTAGRHYLIRGDVAGRSADVVHDDVECPSVSPSGRQVAFKRRRPGLRQVEWDLRVLDLATGRETLLPERRSVDDQLEWLDEDHVLYTMPKSGDEAGPSTDVWLTRVAPDAVPTVFLTNAYSPAVLRGEGAIRLAAPLSR